MTTTNNSSQSVQFFSLSTEPTATAQVTMSTLVALSFARELTAAARKAESRQAVKSANQIDWSAEFSKVINSL